MWQKFKKKKKTSDKQSRHELFIFHGFLFFMLNCVWRRQKYHFSLWKSRIFETLLMMIFDWYSLEQCKWDKTEENMYAYRQITHIIHLFPHLCHGWAILFAKYLHVFFWFSLDLHMYALQIAICLSDCIWIEVCSLMLREGTKQTNGRIKIVLYNNTMSVI